MITIAQSVNGLNPGWVLFKDNRSCFWHFRDDKGVVLCMKSKGSQTKIHRWSPEPSGGNQACPDCRRRTMKVKEPEPEVLAIPEAEPTQDTKKQTETALVENNAKRMTIKEAAELVDVSYQCVYGWANDGKSGLHFDEKTRTLPDSDIPTLEKLLERRNRYLASRGSPGKAKDVTPPAKVVAEKEETKVVAEKNIFDLPEKHRVLAEIIGMNPCQYVEYCLNQVYVPLKNDIQNRLKEALKK